MVWEEHFDWETKAPYWKESETGERTDDPEVARRKMLISQRASLPCPVAVTFRRSPT